MTGIETQTQKLTGAQIFLECLKKVGVDEIFGYPGGVILTIYEALYNCPEITTSCATSRPQSMQQKVMRVLRARQVLRL